MVLKNHSSRARDKLVNYFVGIMHYSLSVIGDFLCAFLKAIMFIRFKKDNWKLAVPTVAKITG